MAPTAECDVLVIGGGVAGLSVALTAAPRTVCVLDAAARPGGASAWAQGGVAAALGAADDPAQHAADTVVAGNFHNDREAVGRMTAGAAAAVAWLEETGVAFDRGPQGELLLGREAAHGHARIVHARGDSTGAVIMGALARAAAQAPHVQILARRRAVALAQDAQGRIVGAWSWNGEALELWRARAVVLATGGYAALYARTTNPVTSDGRGAAIALAAGAQLGDLEFVQFHPTELAATGFVESLPLLTEALRGAGAMLRDDQGEPFMAGMHPRAELAPRDVVARAVAARQLGGHAVYLDARTAVGSAFPERFPTVFQACMRARIDPRVSLVPVSPAAHYCMGGVRVDAAARTTLDGLFAVGEVACTGVHGANRLASNSLLEGLVFGRALGTALIEDLPVAGGAPAPCPRVYRPLDAGTRRKLGDRLWNHAGLLRDGAGLAHVAADLAQWLEEWPVDSSGRDHLALVEAIVSAMRARSDSLGAHWRTDCPHAA